MLLQLAKNLGSNLQPICLLLLRLQMGVLFANAGWNKFQGLERTIGFFQSLHLPAPSILVPVVAAVEFVGGLLLLAGLLNRLASFALIVIMVVAALTAHMSEFTDFVSSLTQDNVVYISMLFALFCFGAGKASVDAVLFGEKS